MCQLAESHATIKRSQISLQNTLDTRFTLHFDRAYSKSFSPPPTPPSSLWVLLFSIYTCIAYRGSNRVKNRREYNANFIAPFTLLSPLVSFYFWRIIKCSVYASIYHPIRAGNIALFSPFLSIPDNNADVQSIFPPQFRPSSIYWTTNHFSSAESRTAMRAGTPNTDSSIHPL